MATRSLLTVPLLITVAAAAAAWLVLGPAAALAFVALAFLEIAMAADSSVPMAGIAGRLHSPARRLFLSLGIVAGVLAMRLLLPPAAVAVGDATDPASSVEEAVFAPGSFSAHLAEVRPALAAFGAAFIWQVFAEYLFNTDRASRRSWLGSLEARLASVARPRVWSLVTAATGVVVTSVLVGSRSGWAAGALLPVALGGVAGIAAYLVSKRTAAWALRSGPGGGGSDTASIGVGRGAWRIHLYASTVVFERGLVVFMLFEILDGVYSLSGSGPLGSDGLGALEQAAVAIGAIGVGAVFLARLTSRVDQAAGLKRLRYLKAGAAYVLGVLSVLLWASLLVPIPGVVVGWFGTVVIGSALVSSLPWRAWWRRVVRRPRAV
ncbi:MULTISPECIES: DUF475 domain-containing protein [Curtobacterium]|jgi:hypothetical protein|uniref:DUF475 domain-containing protein n=1 Tax=Curtobacterium TaxID=2034 RepID=UPI000DAAD289|nr:MULTISPECIES: DUF475 domain-containing protein [Curtobacterium]MCS0646271.1 DUF475 domain-containing protein [Curtobacterium flaccumfaciens pv. flaccumfaciens]MCS6526354.1 DUF475 domain-containing protein [Curtobacterium flaccumfaciens pv. flaccumfaciens]MCS6528292.1 DUF475 domain-containing protein [Curtobacterium flaccumfaciens pv. flaccumfaciens]MCS6558849.1 DUF475 domain-containing protein [Curtobacterium flaccumfaciens]NUU11798.1 DUF475 domain-containing protein [Curtobacterium flaccum